MRMTVLRVSLVSIAIFACRGNPSTHGDGAVSLSRDTLRLPVGSPLVRGRIYAEHKARVVVHRPNVPTPTGEWTNTLTFGDSAGRRIQRWVSVGVQRTAGQEPETWEIFQNYDAETLAPYGFWFRSSNGSEIRLRIDGAHIQGTRRAGPRAAVQTVDLTLPAAAFMTNASDLVPVAVGLREGAVMRAPMWNPFSSEFDERLFVVRARKHIDVEGQRWHSWPVEERSADGQRLHATWYLVEQPPYMLLGEVPLPDGGIQRMTGVLVPFK